MHVVRKTEAFCGVRTQMAYFASTLIAAFGIFWQPVDVSSCTNTDGSVISDGWFKMSVNYVELVYRFNIASSCWPCLKARLLRPGVLTRSQQI